MCHEGDDDQLKNKEEPKTLLERKAGLFSTTSFANNPIFGGEVAFGMAPK